ncbi:DUF2535 family protein [Metabacillus herbersteinensis]|uniref:DUF2535 family protein n=1 Tax=Metabacillus herbersteinensis TaxID=283816 RepID=A0ABV6GL05_9BACI
MLFKSLEFKLVGGQKVKIIDIPVLEEDNKYRFMIQIRLQTFLTTIYAQTNPKSTYSFRDYLKRAIKWSDYEAIFQPNMLRNNA